ncbi:MAG: ABC transporter ATP-binding protein [Nocardioides sp.]|nr:ABC transporter ATP-binding protein [Nocardioides sp.]
MIRTQGLTKYFGRIRAVDDVALEVAEGEIYGFLGPNGSGKTTTVRMLLGLVLATSGSIEMMGHPMPRRAREVLPEVGSLVEGPAAYPGLSGRANLSLVDAMGPGGSRATRSRRIEEALEEVGLAGVDRRPVRAYSLGMRQRLGLAATLMRRPRLLVLDEPTNGLDPQGIHEVRELLLRLNREGTTIFLSSHLLAEVEQLCHRVGVLDRGRLVLQESLAEIRRPTGRWYVETQDVARARALLDGQVDRIEGDRLVVRHDDSAALNRLLVEGGVRVTALTPERRTLEEVVLKATTDSPDKVVRP